MTAATARATGRRYEAARLHRQGLSVYEIAERLNVRSTTVRRGLVAAGALPVRRCERPVAAPVAVLGEGLMAGLPRVSGRCPACGQWTLGLGLGGLVTCWAASCPDQLAASKLLGAFRGHAEVD